MGDRDERFNGVDVESGDHAFAGLTTAALAKEIADDEKGCQDEFERESLKRRDFDSFSRYCRSPDTDDLAASGWGVVLPYAKPDSEAAARQQAILAALGPLLALRRQQAGARYREYVGTGGVRPREEGSRWLARQGAAPGPADPDRVPFYLLLVGSATEIPYAMQRLLGTSYGVGRIDFAEVEEFAAYARGVVAAETGARRPAREVLGFSPMNRDDAVSADDAAWSGALLAKIGEAGKWPIRRISGAAATKQALVSALREAAPAVLWATGHGVQAVAEGPLRDRLHGALVCQDWQGPLHGRGALDPGRCWSGDDVDAGVGLPGVIAFNFASHGAGDVLLGEFTGQTGEAARQRIQSRLHTRLLAHPGGGALALIGHVGRAWGRGAARGQVAAYEWMLGSVLGGGRLGGAFESVRVHRAEIEWKLARELEERASGKPGDDVKLVELWTLRNDLRSLVIAGDPAVRVTSGAEGSG